MAVLGLSFDFHDAAAALIVDGDVVAAAQEERFTRRKHDADIPAKAIEFCLSQAGLKAHDLEAVVYYEMPMVKFDRILKYSQQNYSNNDEYFRNVLVSWFRNGKFDVRERIVRLLGVPAERVRLVRHHDSHIASAFYPSAFDEAAIITLDGVGEYETATISVGRGTTVERLSSVSLPHSLGLFYSAMTAFLGFEVNEGEYKVMGMAGFGSPVHADKLLSLFQLHDDGTFSLDQSCFDFLTPKGHPFTKALVDLFGTPRQPEAPFAVLPGSASAEVLAESKHYADIAASTQRCAEEVILHMARKTLERTGQRNLCMAGGVALNSLANGRIERELGCRLYVHPAAGDSGGALGAAAHYWHASGRPRMTPLATAFLGSAYREDDVLRALSTSGYTDITRFDSDEALVEAVAARLADNQVIGWLQGRAEWGPRALGNRSIIASPCRAEMQLTVNEKIKFREPFRPFAPAVVEERIAEFFEVPDIDYPLAPENFMLAVHRVRPDSRERVPACVHHDGTARVQKVRRADNPVFYDLLQAFGRRTGVPVLMNTSFNLRGEPVVNSPSDALKTFSFSNMDALILNRHLVTKEISL